MAITILTGPQAGLTTPKSPEEIAYEESQKAKLSTAQTQTISQPETSTTETTQLSPTDNIAKINQIASISELDKYITSLDVDTSTPTVELPQEVLSAYQAKSTELTAAQKALEQQQINQIAQYGSMDQLNSYITSLDIDKSTPTVDLPTDVLAAYTARSGALKSAAEQVEKQQISSISGYTDLNKLNEYITSLDIDKSTSTVDLAPGILSAYQARSKTLKDTQDALAAAAKAEQERQDQYQIGQINTTSTIPDLNQYLSMFDVDKSTSTYDLSPAVYAAATARQKVIQDEAVRLQALKDQPALTKIGSFSDYDSANAATNLKTLNDYVKSLDLDKSTPTIELSPSVLSAYQTKQASLTRQASALENAYVGLLNTAPGTESLNNYAKLFDVDKSTSTIELTPNLLSAYNTNTVRLINWNNVSVGQIQAAGYKNLTAWKDALTKDPTLPKPSDYVRTGQTSTGAGIYTYTPTGASYLISGSTVSPILNGIVQGQGPTVPGSSTGIGSLLSITTPTTTKPSTTQPVTTASKSTNNYLDILASGISGAVTTAITLPTVIPNITADIIFGKESPQGKFFDTYTTNVSNVVKPVTSAVVGAGAAAAELGINLAVTGEKAAETYVTSQVKAATENPVGYTLGVVTAPATTAYNVAAGTVTTASNLGQYALGIGDVTEYMSEKHAGATAFDQLITQPSNEATVKAKAAAASPLLTVETGNKDIDNLINGISANFKYGSTQLIETAKGQVGNIAEAATYAATKSEQAALGAEEVGRIGAQTVLLVSPTTSLGSSIATVGTSKDNEELLTNIAFAGALGAAGKLAKGAEGAIMPILETAPTASKIVGTGFKLAEAAPTLYYGGETIIGGAGAVSSAMAGDIATAQEFDRALGVSLATAPFGLKLGEKAVDIGFAAPKVAIQTGIELQKGTLIEPKFGESVLTDVSKPKITSAEVQAVDLSFFKPEAVERIKAAPSFSFLDITAPKYSFMDVATEAQTAAIKAGTGIPLPQMKGIEPLITEAKTGKAATFAKETFSTAFEAEKPIVYRSSAYSLPEKVGGFNYEERGIYTGPALSTIGLKDVKTQGQTESMRLSLFGNDQAGGKALIIQPESITKLPTGKTYGNITAKDIVKLRDITGLDLSKYGEAKYDVKQGTKQIFKAGENIQATEISKVTIGKGRPLKGRDIQMSLTGETYVTKIAPELEVGFVEPKTKAGTATVSIPYTLGRGGEAEFLIYPKAETKITKVQVAERGPVRTFLNRPEAFFYLEGKSIPIEGYKLSTIEKAGEIKAPKQEKPKTTIDYTKRDVDLLAKISEEQITRGTKTKYVPIINPRFGVSVKSEPITTGRTSVGAVSIVPTYGEYQDTFRNYPGYTSISGATPTRSMDILSIDYSKIGRSDVTATNIITSPTTRTSVRDITSVISPTTVPTSTKTTDVTSIFDIRSTEPTTPTRTEVTSIFDLPTTTIPPSTTDSRSVTDISRIFSEPSTRATSTRSTSTRETRSERPRVTVSRRSRPEEERTTSFPGSSGSGRELGMPSSAAYNVYVRKGVGPYTQSKKKVQEVLVAKGLPYNKAVQKGLETADIYSQRTAIIKKVKGATTELDIPRVSEQLMGKFRQPVGRSKIGKEKNTRTFIEKSKYAIQSQQEKAGIPYKSAMLAPQRAAMKRSVLGNIFGPQKKSKGNKSGWMGMRV